MTVYVLLKICKSKFCVSQMKAWKNYKFCVSQMKAQKNSDFVTENSSERQPLNFSPMNSKNTEPEKKKTLWQRSDGSFQASFVTD